MAVAGRNINGLENLDQEIQRLKRHGKKLERQMDSQLDFLQDNYSSMVLKSFIPQLAGKNGLAGTIIQLFFEHKRLQDATGKLLSIALDKVSEGLDFVVDKLGGSKE